MNESNKEVLIDYLSLTFPLMVLAGDNEEEIKNEVIIMLRDYLGLDQCEVEESGYSVNGFQEQYTLSKHIILRLCGPRNSLGFKTCQLELRGEGCREFERLSDGKTWYDFFTFLETLSPKYKRLDVSIDDFDGDNVNMKYLITKFDNKYYTSVFKSPYKLISSINKGDSITFGSTTSGTQLCIYDKRLEQMSKGRIVNKNYWTRYEMRFRQENADAMVQSLIYNYDDPSQEIYGLNLKAFALQHLYRILDIKKDNGYSLEHQYEIETDEPWKDFLDNVEKGAFKKADPRALKIDNSTDYILPKFMIIFMSMLIRGKGNFNLYEYAFYKDMYNLSGKISKAQFKRLNLFLKETGNEQITMAQYEYYRKQIYNKYMDMEVPF